MSYYDPDDITQNYRNAENARYAILTDRTVNSLTAGLAAQFAPGKPASYANSVAARMATGGILRQFGHDPYALMQGAGNLAANSSVYTSSNLGGVRTSGMLTSGGGLSDQFARNIYDHVQKNYLTASGAGRMAQTAGMSSAQMGDVFNIMQKRGMTAGINAGEVGKDTAGRITLKTPEETFKKIDEQFKSVTQVLAATKKMFGGSGSMTELAAIAEKVSGMTLSANGPAAILQRLNSLNSYAKRMGVSNIEAANRLEGTTQNLMSMGYSRPMASAMSLTAGNTGALAVKMADVTAAQAAGRGRYIAPQDENELRQIEAAQQHRFLAETPSATVAMHLLQNRADLSQEGKDQLNSALSNLKNATSPKEIRTARAAMEKAIRGATGSSSAAIIESEGGINEVNARLSGESQMELADMASSAMGNRNSNIIKNIIKKQNLGRQFKGQFSTDELTSASNAMLSGMGKNEAANMQNALAEGDTSKALEILNQNKDVLQRAGMGKGGDVLRQMLEKDPTKAAAFLENITTSAGQHKEIKSTVSFADREAATAADKAKRFEKQFGTGSLKTGSFRDVVSSLMGTTDQDITNEQVMRSIMMDKKSKRHTFDIKTMGQTAESASELNKIISSYGKDKNALFKAYGVKPGDDAALAAAIKQNPDKLNNLMTKEGVVGAKTGNETLTLATKDESEKASKDISYTAKAARQLKLEGVDSASKDFEKQVRERAKDLRAGDSGTEMGKSHAAQMEKEHQEKMAKYLGLEGGISQWVTGASDRLKRLSDPNNSQFKALQAEYKNDPTSVLAMLDKAKNAVRGTKGGGSRLEELEKLEKNLKEGTNNEKNFLGVLRIEKEGSSTLGLYGPKGGLS